MLNPLDVVKYLTDKPGEINYFDNPRDKRDMTPRFFDNGEPIPTVEYSAQKELYKAYIENDIKNNPENHE